MSKFAYLKRLTTSALSKKNVNITALISKSVINWSYIWVECRVNSRENQLSRWLSGKESSCQAGHVGLIPGPRDPLEKELATHSSILVWKIPWTEETGGLQFIGSQWVRHDQNTKPPTTKRESGDKMQSKIDSKSSIHLKKKKKITDYFLKDQKYV